MELLNELLKVIFWFGAGLIMGFYLGYRYRFLDRFIDIFKNR